MTDHQLRPEGLAPIALTALAATVGAAVADQYAGVEISGITQDSRAARPGDLYVALKGARVHGARFTDQAAAAGAVAVLTDSEGAEQVAGQLPVLEVPAPREAMAYAAAEIYHHPTRQLRMVGITGTNGKTTTTALTAAGLRGTGHVVGTIGTLGFWLDDQELTSDRTTVTTPESCDLHALFAVMLQRGADTVVMEVSSHALALQRVTGVHFDVAGFTNLGRDHLDFHPTMEDYFQAKASLFQQAGTAVIVVDGEWGARLAGECRAAGVPVLSVSGSADARTDIHPLTDDVDHPTAQDPEQLGLHTPSGDIAVPLAMPGTFNRVNSGLAVGLWEVLDEPVQQAAQALATATVPGRMQLVEVPGGPRVVVDFAHTPQAVAAALTALSVPGGRLIAVLGAGGDRDPDKRGPMGEAAAEWAEVVIVTDDNPRSEDPAAIRAAVLAGAEQVRQTSAERGRVITVVEVGGRDRAIGAALARAGVRDTVAILGKGHETGQILAEETIDFDDAIEVVRQWAQLHPGAGR
ncbi:UDP-N-acetylmuramoyl-L-alanyl-D-glutamate--2,6-diaminopimelate ligase [Parenemella sanctibonifatiensis]|uniref:UDP-N-acetylmuramoyl-L-alanyl-D-glutamate--2,6-diaminopimelate ligase n=1 Tax=Parenemella sanctibonifatiensis TaxID=2016505 RepID=A0A255E9Z6_9ACTN|nr:UDP-N-acetylmuramoyl-L-alanyl-D-glutamate--2,6-diaminopimelate ligase [Parenemella sanctibonifatiensis]OYN88336.1 UDP-N-acetylmuramoyl-L-alanyl-D-glutamate--2,6-diaminopimelate ligase [Parenemella sanctibonifatiensis]